MVEAILERRYPEDRCFIESYERFLAQRTKDRNETYRDAYISIAHDVYRTTKNLIENGLITAREEDLRPDARLKDIGIENHTATLRNLGIKNEIATLFMTELLLRDHKFRGNWQQRNETLGDVIDYLAANKLHPMRSLFVEAWHCLPSLVPGFFRRRSARASEFPLSDRSRTPSGPGSAKGG